MSTVVEVEQLRKSYGAVEAVRDVSFSVAAGEIFGLIGPNGAGKTTTVECLLGLRRADGGCLSVLGLDPARETHALRRRVGCQLQESALPDRMRVWEALDLFASLAPGRSDWRALMSDWGLADKRDAPFAALSGGQRQRLFVALALVNDPEVVFLDEMAEGLDPAGRRTARELLRALRERGTTVVLVTHDMDEAEQLCDRVAVIAAGRVVALDTVAALVGRYGRATRVLFGAAGVDLDGLERVPHVDRVEVAGNVVAIEGTGPVLAYVAAELVRRGTVPDDLRLERDTLEDVFLSLTQPELEPGAEA